MKIHKSITKNSDPRFVKRLVIAVRLSYSRHMNFRQLLLLCLSCAALGACQTIEGLQKDFGTLGGKIDQTVGSTKAALASASSNAKEFDGTCPSIIVDPQLDSLSEFSDPQNPSDETRISSIRLARTQSVCEIEDQYIVMRVDLSFEGNLGPKARRKDSDRPFFAYPYFIGITDTQDNELAREMFAASVTYDTDQQSIELVETIRQRLPLNEDGSVPPYQVHIGFQLSQEQLFYNASL